jgi:hypothetical protein
MRTRQIEVALKGYRFLRRLGMSLVTASGLLLLTGCQGLFAGSSSSSPIAFATGSLNFGTVPLGTTKTLTDTMVNHTTSPVTISAIQGLTSEFQITGVTLPIVLAAGQSVPFTVTFQPADPGDPTIAASFAGPSATYGSLPITGAGAPFGKLSPSPEQIAFGNIQVGSNQTRAVTLTNSGGTELTVTQATLSGAGFAMSNLATPFTLKAGASASITITFAPPGAGSFSGNVSFATTCFGQNSNVVLSFSGIGLTPGLLSPNPSSLAFGSVQVGSSSSKTETLTNTGGSTVNITQVVPSGSGFSFSGLTLPFLLAINESVTFNVIYAPTSAGAVSGALNLVSNASNTPLSIPLSGTGLAAGALAATPASVSFGNVTVGNNSTASVVITNTGGAAVTLSTAAASGSGFSMTGQALPITLTAGQSTSFNVVFTPAASGAASGALTINSNAVNGTLSVPLSGTGVAQGQLVANPTSFTFGSVQIGASKSLTGTLTNSGGASLTISAAAASGTGFSLSGLAPGLILAAGQSTSFTVLFSPTASGSASGSLNITSNGENPNLSIPLSGTGVTAGDLVANPTSVAFGSVQVGAPKSLTETLTNSGGTTLQISAAAASGTGFSLSGLALPVTLTAGQSTSFTITFNPSASGSASGNVSITSTGSDSNLSIPLSGTGVTAGDLVANPASLAFGSVQVGSSTNLSETLTNTGGTSLTISAISASGAGFSLSGIVAGVTLAAGQSTSFTVTFDPSASGAASGNVSITSTGSDSNLTIPLSGTGVSQGDLVANPTSVAFGSVQVGAPKSLTETLTNSGGTTLQISAAAASGTGFSLSGLALPVTLTAGQSTSFTITFNPSASGAASGNVSITSTGSDSNLTIPLSGTGVTAGDLVANPASLAFGSVQVGSSTNLSETLTNTGGTSLTISAISASGAGFSLSGIVAGATLAAGQSTSFTVTFDPSASGAASGSVSITSTGSDSNLTIPLSGTGVTAGTLAANPSSLAFSSTQLGSSTNLSETLTNTGGSTVAISAANVTGAAFSISGLSGFPINLTSGQSVTFTATFTPSSAGAASGSLSIVSNASNSPLNIALSGTGTAAGTLAVSPTSLSFGSVVVGASSSLNGSLTASGASVTVNSASLNNSEFVLSGFSPGVTIAAGQSVSFTVTFTPQASGATSASLSFASNASNSPAVQSMTGTGTAQTQHTVDLSWNASASAVGYNIYRGTVSGGPYAIINSSLDATTTYTDSTVVSGQTYYYVTTAVNSDSQESGYSNQAQAIIPNP